MPGILSDEPRVFRPVGLPIVARVPVSTKNPADKKRFSDSGITLASDKGALAFHCGVPASLLPLLSDDNGSHAEPVLDAIGRRAKKSGIISDFIITSAFDELASVALVVFPSDPKKPDECLRMIADIAESSFGGLIARVPSEDDDHDSQTAQTKAAALRVFESFEIQAEIQASCPYTAKILPLRKSI